LQSEEFCHEVFNIASEDTRILRSFVEEIYNITGSRSQLLYNANLQKNIVSLQPDVKKLHQATHFVPSTSFGAVIRKIVDNR
jgi:nucleoside-diphosphate-sugar epimerase